MKVIILTEGGEDIGFGHVARCLSLYQVFETRGHELEFIIAGDDSIKNILQIKFKFLNWHEEEKKLFFEIKNADVVVVDSYLAEYGIYKKISDAITIPVFIDDNCRLGYPRGIVVNWNIHAHDLDYPKDNNVSYLLGPNYIAMRRAFWEVPEKKINQKVTEVMVSFGGDDSKNLTPKVLSFLVRRYPELKKHVVIGPAFKNFNEIEAAADTNTQLIQSPDDTGMKEIMLKSDIAIASGGQTLYELARVGVPPVAVAVADNQRNSVNGWERAGFIENAGYWTDKDLMVNLAAKFQRLLDVERRVHASGIGRLKVPGNGAGKIIQVVEKTRRS
jgi:UDP-2,4-diacetamido-2,4,6-trideoxy-beta-L-altropyranose hydrolase